MSDADVELLNALSTVESFFGHAEANSALMTGPIVERLNVCFMRASSLLNSTELPRSSKARSLQSAELPRTNSAQSSLSLQLSSSLSLQSIVSLHPTPLMSDASMNSVVTAATGSFSAAALMHRSVASPGTPGEGAWVPGAHGVTRDLLVGTLGLPRRSTFSSMGSFDALEGASPSVRPGSPYWRPNACSVSEREELERLDHPYHVFTDRRSLSLSMLEVIETDRVNDPVSLFSPIQIIGGCGSLLFALVTACFQLDEYPLATRMLAIIILVAGTPPPICHSPLPCPFAPPLLC